MKSIVISKEELRKNRPKVRQFSRLYTTRIGSKRTYKRKMKWGKDTHGE